MASGHLYPPADYSTGGVPHRQRSESRSLAVQRHNIEVLTEGGSFEMLAEKASPSARHAEPGTDCLMVLCGHVITPQESTDNLPGKQSRSELNE